MSSVHDSETLLFSGNRVLNPSARRNTETLATSPFKLVIEPQVSVLYTDSEHTCPNSAHLLSPILPRSRDDV